MIEPQTTSYNPEEWIEECEKNGLTTPHKIVSAMVTFLAHLTVKAEVRDGLPPATMFIPASMVGLRVGLTLSAVSPKAAGWLLEAMSVDDPQSDRESQAAALFLRDLVDHLT